MAWESRGGRGRYYTRSERRGGRVVRTYIGRGRVAELAARMDTLERARRAERAEDARTEQDRLIAADAAIAALDRAAADAMREALAAAGYHQHHRGEWRKRRADQAPE